MVVVWWCDDGNNGTARIAAGCSYRCCRMHCGVGGGSGGGIGVGDVGCGIGGGRIKAASNVVIKIIIVIVVVIIVRHCCGVVCCVNGCHHIRWRYGNGYMIVFTLLAATGTVSMVTAHRHTLI